MIVVVGTPAWHPAEPAHPAGLACEIALAAAAAGSPVELVGRTGDDAAGDALVLFLAHAGVGHVALLRDPVRSTRLDPPPPARRDDGRSRGRDATRQALSSPADEAGVGPAPALEPADVRLGLAYLTAFEVLIVSDDVPADVIPACLDAATFAGAQLIVILPAHRSVPAALPPDATVLAAPGHANPAFAHMVGRYAAGLASGSASADAFESAVHETGWEALPMSREPG